MIRCDICGKEFEAGNRPSGIPNGLGFMSKDGERTVNICAECIMKSQDDANIIKKMEELMNGKDGETET